VTKELSKEAKDDGKALAEPKPKFDLRVFLTEVRAELDKVVWPARQQLISESASVLLIVVGMASFIYLIDEIFKWLSGVVFR
jgi:preprotein translocase subunit SecE